MTRFAFFVLLTILLLPLAAIAQETPIETSIETPIAISPEGTLAQASVDPADPFTIMGVVVDATADNAVAARAKAFADGAQVAVKKFLEAQGASPELHGLKPDTLVRDVRVDREQFSRTRYTASLTYRFKPRAMALLANASLPPAQALPVLAPPQVTPPAPTIDPNAPYAPAAAPISFQTWQLVVRFEQVAQWLQAQSMITARPEVRGYKVVSMGGNNAVLEITAQESPQQTAQNWAALGWPVREEMGGLSLDAMRLAP